MVRIEIHGALLYGQTSTLHVKTNGKDTPMKLVAFIFAAALLLTAGGFAFIAFQDVPVTQTEIVKDIPADRYLANNTQ